MRSSTCVPASCTRRCCWPACGSTCSSDWPRARSDVTLLARDFGLDVDAATRLLDAAVALDLLERRGAGRYGLGELGAALRGNPGVTAMIEHHELLYADLADPVALLRQRAGNTQLAQYWPYATAAEPKSLSTERVRKYTQLMSASQPLVSRTCWTPMTFRSTVACSTSAEVTALSSRPSLHVVPSVRLQLFDLPGVVAIAGERLASGGLSARIERFGGSFASDPLPRGADVISLIRILHDHDDEVACRLLAAVRQALPAGGTVVIGEPLAGAPGAAAMGAAYFGFYLCAMRSGRPRTAAQLTEMLRVAGFEAVRQVPHGASAAGWSADGTKASRRMRVKMT